MFPHGENDEADGSRDYRYPEDEAVKADGEAGTGVNRSSWSRKWLVFHLGIGVRSRMSCPLASSNQH